MKRGLKEKGINRERDTRKRDKSGEGLQRSEDYRGEIIEEG